MKPLRRLCTRAALAALAAAACIPDLGTGDSLLTATRILAVRADPAEAPPGAEVTFTPLVGGPGGVSSGSPIVWDFCSAPRPLTEDNVVSNACLDSSSLVFVGHGPTVTVATPRNGCSLFGPDTPPGGFRPTDPDPTGGYFQPLRADLAGAQTAFALARIHCDLANAGAAAASTFAAAYKPNKNPTLLPLTATIDAAPAALTAVPAGSRVDFTASWSPADAETFAYFDVASQSVTSQRESMQVAWYSTAGAFDTESTGRSSTDTATATGNSWTAPSRAPAVPTYVFVVLRDSRGGVDFAPAKLIVVGD